MSENFEHRVKNLLDEVEFEPHADVWTNVKHAIKTKEKKRRFIFWWLLPFVLAGGIFFFTYSGNNNKEIALNNQVQTVNEKPRDMPSSANEIAEQNSMIGADGDTDKTAQKNLADNEKGKNHTSKTTKPTKAVTKVIIPGNADKQGHILVERKDNPEVSNSNTTETQIAISPQKVKEDKLINASTTNSSNDTASTKSIAEVVNIDKRSSKNWQFGLYAEIGVSNAVKNIVQKSSGYSRVSFSAIPNSTATGGFNSSFYSRTTNIGNFLWGAGIAAQKDINRKISFQSSIGYQHQQFSTATSIYKDSASPVLQERMTTDHKLHFLNIYTGLSFKLAQVDEFKINLGGGIDNEFLLASKFNQQKYTPTASQFSSQTNNFISDHRIWQPHIRVQLLTEIPSAKRNLLQLSPYLRYGVRSFEKKPVNKNHLMSFGLTATYFFK